MGRPEQPLRADGTPAVEFAIWLRDAKRRADLTYEEISARSGYATTTVQDACNGRRLPSLRALRAIVEALGEDPEPWADYWAALKRIQDQAGPGTPANLRPPWAPPVDDALEVAEPAALTEAEINRAPHLRRQSGHRGLFVLAACAGVAIAAAFLWPSGSAGATRGLVEEEYNRHGAPTFADPHTPSGAEGVIPFQTKVRVSCKLLAPSVPSLSPDGYWYRIASGRWKGSWAAANTFLNGDSPGNGPFEHNTDFTVPSC